MSTVTLLASQGPRTNLGSSGSRDVAASGLSVADEAFQWIEKEEFLMADLDLVRARMVDYIITLTQE